MIKSVSLTLVLCIKIDARSEERGIGMELFCREQYLSKIRGFYHENDIIKVITGVRRRGKSSLMEYETKY